MAVWDDDFDEAAFDAWLLTRPQVIQDIGKRIRPNRLYRMAKSGHRCYPLAFNEDGTIRVAVTGQFNQVAFSRQVFGINPDELTECELPGPEEPVGDYAAETGTPVEDIVAAMQAAMKKTQPH